MGKDIVPTNPEQETAKGRIALWLAPEDVRWLASNCSCADSASREESERCARIRFRANAALHKAGLGSEPGEKRRGQATPLDFAPTRTVMIPPLLNSLDLTIGFLRRLVDDVPDDKLTRQPRGVINHPAWVLGHLAYSFQGLGEEFGLPPWLPEGWTEVFGTGSIPTDRRDRYPEKSVLLDALLDGKRRITEALETHGESALEEPLPDERYRPIFPTLGHAVIHILTAHTAVHVGQAITWRRAVGLPPLAEVFI